MQANLPDTEFAFLATCCSVARGREVSDEVINLAAAMQFCGFRNTVGTLWRMRDDDGPVLAGEFYKHLLREGRGDIRHSAMALNTATKALREAGVPPDRWATYVHIGI